MSYLQIENLSRSYDTIRALEGFSLALNRSEIMALVGPDGAGKTTLIRILCNLLAANGGTIRLGEKDLLKDFDWFKPKLGYMPQIFSLYPDLSVEENLTFYAGIYGITGEAYRRRRDEMYSFSNLAPFAGRRAGALSGGMKQKLALSCALMHDPELLVLDEPTTGVDPLSRRQFWEILLELKQRGVTILVSTPYMDEVARADRACFIFAGKKLSEGRPHELARQFDGEIYFADVKPDVQLMGGLAHIPGLLARRFGAGFHLYTAKGMPLESFREPLAKAGVDLSQVHTIEPSLEDRFIQLMEQVS